MAVTSGTIQFLNDIATTSQVQDPSGYAIDQGLVVSAATTGGGGASLGVLNATAFGHAAQNGADKTLRVTVDAATTLDSVTFASNDGSEFQLDGLVVGSINDAGSVTYTVTARRDGSDVGFTTFTSATHTSGSSTSGNRTISLGTDFENIDAFVVTATGDTINVLGFDDIVLSAAVVPAPETTLPMAPTVDEDSAANAISGISISQASVAANYSVTLTAANGAIDVTGFGGAATTDSDGSDGTLAFNGTLSEVNTALSNLTFSPTDGFSGTASIQVDVSDGGGGTDSDTLTVTVRPEPDVTDVVEPVDGSYRAAQTIDFLVTYDTPVLVTGAPRLVLSVGGETKYAVYESGSGTTALVFRYQPANGDADADGISLTSTNIDLNTGAIASADGVAAALALTGLDSLANVRVDTAAPAAPAVPDLSPGSDLGRSNSDNITYDTMPTFEGGAGSVEALATVTLASDLDGALGSTTADANGAWSFEAAALSGGDHAITATATDAAGNVSAASTVLDITIDATPPSVTSVSIPNSAAKIGDAITVSLSASEAGLSLTTGTVNGVAVTGFTDIGGGDYTAVYTVQEGDPDRAAGEDIPVTFVLADAAGNNSAAFTTAISQDDDAIDGFDDPPTYVPPADTVLQADGRDLSLSLLEGAGDPEGAPLTVQMLSATSDRRSDVALTMSAGGVVVFDSAQFRSLTVGDQETITLRFTLSDGSKTTDVARDVTVIGASSGPIAEDDSFTFTGGTVELIGNVLAANGGLPDRDPDGDVLRVTEINGRVLSEGEPTILDLASGAMLTLFDSGEFRYALNRDAENEALADRFEYTISDAAGNENTATVSFAYDASLADNAARIWLYNAEDLPALTDLPNFGPGGALVLSSQELTIEQISVVSTDAGAFVEIDTDGDGVADATVDISESYDGGGFLTSAIGQGATTQFIIEYLPDLPTLAETISIAPSAINGLIGEAFLTGNGARGYDIAFVESQAAFDSLIGSYIVREDGTIDTVEIVFGNTNETPAGETVRIAPLADRDVLGLFLIAGGAGLADSDTLEFVSGPGDATTPANAFDGETPLLLADGQVVSSDVFHIFGELNEGGAEMIWSGVDPADGSLMVGFEDVLGAETDRDYNDVIIDVFAA